MMSHLSGLLALISPFVEDFQKKVLAFALSEDVYNAFIALLELDLCDEILKIVFPVLEVSLLRFDSEETICH